AVLSTVISLLNLVRSFIDQDVGYLKQNGRRSVHVRPGRRSLEHPPECGEHKPSKRPVIKAIGRGWAEGKVIERLQKSLSVEEECLFATGFEAVVGGNVRR